MRVWAAAKFAEGQSPASAEISANAYRMASPPLSAASGFPLSSWSARHVSVLRIVLTTLFG
jgi:hypothetical protein